MLPDATVRYADHDDAVIDLHLPEEPSGRLVVLVHGGFWKQVWDRRHTRTMARALADAGCVVATPEYRRVGGGGGWPTTCEDVRDAVARLPELLAGLDVPVGPLTVTGHSAGGHLALWLATTGLRIERVVALAPVCDLEAAARLGLGDDATQAFLGGVDAAEADPMLLFSQRPPAEVVIVHGVEDDDVPVSLSRGFTAAHPWVELREVPVGHMEVIEPASLAWPVVLDALGSTMPSIEETRPS
jgi:acetyl esterase/lipase